MREKYESLDFAISFKFANARDSYFSLIYPPFILFPKQFFAAIFINF